MKDLAILLLGLMRKYNGNVQYEKVQNGKVQYAIIHYVRQRALTGFSSAT